MDCHQVERIGWGDAAFHIERRRNRRVFDPGEVLVNGQMVVDASEACAPLKYVAIACRLLNQSLHSMDS